jgi:phage head maturation protease
VHERIALLSPSFDPREGERSFQRKLDGRPPTAIAAGALQLKPGTGVPVLLEHDRSRPLGYVRSLFLMPRVDRLTWHAAILELNDDGWPSHQGVSIGSVPVRETTLLSGERIIEEALVDEISITTAPAIPGARLLTPTTERTTPGRQRIPSASATATPRTLIRRDCGQILRVR